MMNNRDFFQSYPNVLVLSGSCPNACPVNSELLAMESSSHCSSMVSSNIVVCLVWIYMLKVQEDTKHWARKTVTKFKSSWMLYFALRNLGQEIPIPLLLRRSGFLSFHQMCAHSTLKTTHKILSTKEPVELFQAISNSRPSADRPRRYESSQTHYKLSISRESYLYQAVKLFFSLPENWLAIDKPEQFKKISKAWVGSNM